ncbi:MAG: molybdenum cofactor guanylyltransferase [Gammaproteobacteria bacterium]|nr:molybdenum cofactor guanylyltransferase [Gammaproteobacteria bacterium]
MLDKNKIAGIVLAGGKAARMNYCDKPLMPLLGKPLIEHVIALATPQVGELLISVNRNLQDYAYLDLPLIADSRRLYGGPLVGIYSAMRWLLKTNTAAERTHLACFAADVPRFPLNLVSTLAAAMVQPDCQVAVARTGTQLQPLFSLWSLTTFSILEAAIAENLCGPKLIFPRLDTVEVEFNDTGSENFMNINTPSQLSGMEQLLSADQAPAA